MLSAGSAPYMGRPAPRQVLEGDVNLLELRRPTEPPGGAPGPLVKATRALALGFRALKLQSVALGG